MIFRDALNGLMGAAVIVIIPLMMLVSDGRADSTFIDYDEWQALTESKVIESFDEIVFIKRFTYQSNHYYTDYINGCRNFGGNLCVLSLKDRSVRELVPSLSGGIFGRFDLSCDGQAIVFGYKEKIGKGFRIYEVGVDGKNLKQLTFEPPDEAERIRKYNNNREYPHHTDDMNPCYLPDGGICFISTRCEYSILCDGPDIFTTTVLYRMDADGGNMRKLSNSSVSEATPSITHDGRILYTRWEYLDKGAVSVKCLWAMNPDGSNSMEIYGNDIALPPTLLYGRVIPGSDHLYVAAGTPHYPQFGVGTIIRIDVSKPLRTREPMTYITPAIDIRAEAGFHHKVSGQWVQNNNGPLFTDPWPLSESAFLVSYNPDKHFKDTKAYGLYWLDEKGVATLVYRDDAISCFEPVPLRSRKRPPVIPSALPKSPDSDRATLMVADVYRGLSGVSRGTVKYIRVNEQVPRPWSARRRWSGDVYDQQHAVITKDTHLGLKVQHGIVTVEEDGSAHFTVPADKNIFLQLLDADYMEVQRERTFVNYRPGEIRSCVGCHEGSNLSPPVSMTRKMAFQRPPETPGPQPGEISGRRVIHYSADVQPVLDKHCVRCHGGDAPKAKLDLTGEMTTHFSRSYENILSRKLLPVIGENHPKTGNIHYLPPFSLGSHKSKLIQMLLKGHQDVDLSQEEMVKLTTWVDSNGQYYGAYWGRRNLRYKDHKNFRPVPTFHEAVSTTSPLMESER